MSLPHLASSRCPVPGACLRPEEMRRNLLRKLPGARADLPASSATTTPSCPSS